ncbi:MAG TPA: hypothetical protein VK638_44805 [Edaphobacter sp.]|nr:hypothetical protein [Edaphobacter sp.]
MNESERKIWNEAIEAAVQEARLADVDVLYGSAGNKLRSEIISRIWGLSKWADGGVIENREPFIVGETVRNCHHAPWDKEKS